MRKMITCKTRDKHVRNFVVRYIYNKAGDVLEDEIDNSGENRYTTAGERAPLGPLKDR